MLFPQACVFGTNARVLIILKLILYTVSSQTKLNKILLLLKSIDILHTISVYIYIYVYTVSLEKAIIARPENYSEPLRSIFNPPLTQEVPQNERKKGLSRSHEPFFSFEFIPWDVALNDLHESLSMKVLFS